MCLARPGGVEKRKIRQLERENAGWPLIKLSQPFEFPTATYMYGDMVSLPLELLLRWPLLSLGDGCQESKEVVG